MFFNLFKIILYQHPGTCLLWVSCSHSVDMGTMELAHFHIGWFQSLKKKKTTFFFFKLESVSIELSSSANAVKTVKVLESDKPGLKSQFHHLWACSVFRKALDLPELLPFLVIPLGKWIEVIPIKNLAQCLAHPRWVYLLNHFLIHSFIQQTFFETLVATAEGADMHNK